MPRILQLHKIQLGGGIRESGPRLLWIAGLVIANLAVAWAIQLHDGEYTPLAIALIAVAIVTTVIVISQAAGIYSLPLWGRFGVRGYRGRHDVPDEVLEASPHPNPLPEGEGVNCSASIDIFHWTRIVQLALLILFLFLAIGAIHANPNPHIDVWVFQQQGAR